MARSRWVRGIALRRSFCGHSNLCGAKIRPTILPDNVEVAEELPRAVTQTNTMGDPHAPIHIIEYGDFQCPYCLRFWNETEPLLIEEYVNTGKVYFEYRSFPFLGPESVWAAEGATAQATKASFGNITTRSTPIGQAKTWAILHRIN